MSQKNIIANITTLGVVLGGLAVQGAQAQIWIEERQHAEFPLTLIPDSRKKIVLKPNGSLGASTTAEFVGSRSSVSGHYVISSDTDRTISVNILSNEDDPSIRLKNFKVKYQGVTYKNFPVSGLPSPGDGEDLYVGFTAILKSSAGEGERFPSYTIDINEE